MFVCCFHLSQVFYTHYYADVIIADDGVFILTNARRLLSLNRFLPCPFPLHPHRASLVRSTLRNCLNVLMTSFRPSTMDANSLINCTTKTRWHSSSLWLSERFVIHAIIIFLFQLLVCLFFYFIMSKCFECTLEVWFYQIDFYVYP